jgi:hypothetical protein
MVATVQQDKQFTRKAVQVGAILTVWDTDHLAHLAAQVILAEHRHTYEITATWDGTYSMAYQLVHLDPVALAT